MNLTKILHSTSIFTGTQKIEGYIGIENDTIVKIQKNPFPVEQCAKDCIFYDVGNHTIMPGLHDAHTFFTGWIMNQVGVDFASFSKAKFIDHIQNSNKIFGYHFDLNIENIDELCKDKIVVLWKTDGTLAYVSKSATNFYGFDVEADCNEVFVHYLDEILQDKNYVVTKWKEYQHLLHQKGVTSIKEIGYDTFSNFVDILYDLQKKNQLTLRVNYMSQPVKEGMNLDYGIQQRKKREGTHLHFTGYNRMTDGSISQYMGYLKEPYKNTNLHCKQDIDWTTIEKEVLEADANGFRFSLNAQGDAAVRRVIDIYNKCQKNPDGTLKNRHAITEAEYSDSNDYPDIARLGIIVEYYPQIQSISSYRDKLQMIDEKLGLEKGHQFWNRRGLKDAGVRLCTGTDLPLVIDDLGQGLYHTNTCCFLDSDTPFHPENALTISEILSSYTAEGAFDQLQEEKVGTLSEGKLADIIILNADVFSQTKKGLLDIEVTHTFIDGQSVFQKK